MAIDIAKAFKGSENNKAATGATSTHDTLRLLGNLGSFLRANSFGQDFPIAGNKVTFGSELES